MHARFLCLLLSSLQLSTCCLLTVMSGAVFMTVASARTPAAAELQYLHPSPTREYACPSIVSHRAHIDAHFACSGIMVLRSSERMIQFVEAWEAQLRQKGAQQLWDQVEFNNLLRINMFKNHYSWWDHTDKWDRSALQLLFAYPGLINAFRPLQGLFGIEWVQAIK